MTIAPMRRVSDFQPSRRWIDVMFVVVTVFLICAMFIMAASLYSLNKRQAEAIQQQNDAQLCAQHEIVVAVRQIGTKLGLDVSDMTVPDIRGLDCP